MESKKCSRCLLDKPLGDFSIRKDRPCGYQSRCKKCIVEISRLRYFNVDGVRDRALEYQKKYRKESPVSKNWFEKNKESLTEKKRIYRTNNKQYSSNRNKRSRDRWREDPMYRFKQNIRNRFREAVKHGYKSGKTLELLGCSIEFFNKHIENQFKDGMTWENYSHSVWHIDHKIPCAAFDLSKPEEQKKCFHYSNLRPMWAKENMKKGAKLITEYGQGR